MVLPRYTHTHPMVSTVNLSVVKNKIKPLVNHIAIIRQYHDKYSAIVVI